MRQDDIEKILQQYGADRRQQQQAADSLHGLARRQRRRALMVCSAVILATTVWTVYQFALPQQEESVVVAQQNSPTITQTPDNETVPQNIYPISRPEKKHPISTSSTTQPLPEPAQEEHIATYEVTEPAAIATALQSDDKDTLQINTPKPEEPRQPTLQPFDSETLLLADNPEIQPSDFGGKRFRFTASIGASTLPKIGSGTPDNIDIIEQNGLTSPSESLTRMSPSTTLAANVGVNYSIPLGERQCLELGVGVSGYSHQTEVTTYQVVTANGVDGDIVAINPVGDPERNSSFSLYASLPLTFNFRSKSTNMGWNMSITPSHSLLSSHTVGALAPRRSIINPWRLTMGVGVALPRGIVRRISLTANLLSLYTSSSLHEVGIEIGF